MPGPSWVLWGAIKGRDKSGPIGVKLRKDEFCANRLLMRAKGPDSWLAPGAASRLALEQQRRHACRKSPLRGRCRDGVLAFFINSTILNLTPIGYPDTPAPTKQRRIPPQA